MKPIAIFINDEKNNMIEYLKSDFNRKDIGFPNVIKEEEESQEMISNSDIKYIGTRNMKEIESENEDSKKKVGFGEELLRPDFYKASKEINQDYYMVIDNLDGSGHKK